MTYVCADLLEVEVTVIYQLVVQRLERSLGMQEYSDSIPDKYDH
jgi:hypothetical protein